MRRFFRYFYDYRGVCIWMCLSGAVFAVVFAMYGITRSCWRQVLHTAGEDGAGWSRSCHPKLCSLM